MKEISSLYKEFNNSIFSRIWNVVAKINYLSFEDARTFARSLKLKTQKGL